MEVPGRRSATSAPVRGVGSPGHCPPPPAAAGGQETGLGHLHALEPLLLPPTPCQISREKEDTGDPGRRGGSLSLEGRQRVRAARLRSSPTGAGLRTPLLLPHLSRASLLRSGRFPPAARPAEAGGAVVEGEGPLPLRTRSHPRPGSPVHTPQSSAQPHDCVLSGALARQTHITEPQAEPRPAAATQSAEQTLPVSPPRAPTSRRRPGRQGQTGGRWGTRTGAGTRVGPPLALTIAGNVCAFMNGGHTPAAARLDTQCPAMTLTGEIHLYPQLRRPPAPGTRAPVRDNAHARRLLPLRRLPRLRPSSGCSRGPWPSLPAVASNWTPARTDSAPPAAGPASLPVRAPRGGALARYCHGDGKPVAVVAAPPRGGGCEPAETERGRAAGPPGEEGARTRPAAAVSPAATARGPPGRGGARVVAGSTSQRPRPAPFAPASRGPSAAQRPPPAPPAASSAPRGNGR